MHAGLLKRARPSATGLAVVLTAIVIAIFSVAFSAPIGAQQNDRARTEALAARASARMRALQREADDLAQQERTLLGDLRKLEVERQIKIEALRQLDAQGAQLTRELAAANSRIETLQAEDLAARPVLRERIVEMYKLGKARYARLIFSASDARRIGEAVRTAAALAKLDRDRIVSHRRTLDELSAVRATLADRGRQLEALRADARRAAADVESAAVARSAAITDIDRQRDLNAQLSGELLEAQHKLQASLDALASGAPVPEPAGLPLKLLRGDLDWPVAGAVRRRFAPAPDGRTPASNGIEIAAAPAAPVAAVHEGVVDYAAPFAGFGNLVIVDHGGQAYSLYGNLLDVSVQKGARLEAGQPVGTVGASVTGPAGLYFELRVDGQPVDPLQWLKKR
jgi:murein hydrolase activator